jgi:hypothetical protein
VLAALLTQLDAARLGLRGMAFAAAVVAVFAVAAFVPSALLARGIVSALVGLALYTAFVLVLRPRGLKQSWAYLRAL